MGLRPSSCHRSLCPEGSAGLSPSEWNKSMPMSQFHTSHAGVSRRFPLPGQALFTIATRGAAVRPWAARSVLALLLHCLSHSPPRPSRARQHTLFDKLPLRGRFTNQFGRVVESVDAQHPADQCCRGEK